MYPVIQLRRRCRARRWLQREEECPWRALSLSAGASDDQSRDSLPVRSTLRTAHSVRPRSNERGWRSEQQQKQQKRRPARTLALPIALSGSRKGSQSRCARVTCAHNVVSNSVLFFLWIIICMRGAARIASRAMEIDSPPSMRSQQADRYIAQMWLRAELCTQSWDAARVQPCGWPPPSPLRVQRFPMSPHTLETADWLAPSTFRRDDPPRTRHRQASQPASQPGPGGRRGRPGPAIVGAAQVDGGGGGRSVLAGWLAVCCSQCRFAHGRIDRALGLWTGAGSAG